MPSTSIATLYVMLGGAIGAALRYHAGRLFAVAGHGLPYATLFVNIIGGLAMGVLAGWLHQRLDGEPMRLLLGVGVLGGFTTFSAFSLEMVRLIESGAITSALTYALLSVLGSVFAVFIGLMAVRAVA